MKNLATVSATLVLMLALALPPAGAHASDERPTAQTCLWHPAPALPVGVVCATGTIGHVGPFDCDIARNGCFVTKTGDLSVEPVACGWLKFGDLQKCATEKPELDHRDETQFYAAGEYRMESEVCISDPTVTVTYPCEKLVHYFTVPSQNTAAIVPVDPVQAVQNVVARVLALGDDAEGTLVYSSGTFDVYQLAIYA